MFRTKATEYSKMLEQSKNRTCMFNVSQTKEDIFLFRIHFMICMMGTHWDL